MSNEADAAKASSKAWRRWFERLGERATAEIVNATADLVIDERLAALAQAGVLPNLVWRRGSEAEGRQRAIKLLRELRETNDPAEIARQKESWAQLQDALKDASPSNLSSLARKAAEEIREWLRTGDGEVDANAINEVAAIIERCLSEGEA